MTFKSFTSELSLLVSSHAASATKESLTHLQSARPNILVAVIWKFIMCTWSRTRLLKSCHLTSWGLMKKPAPSFRALSLVMSTYTTVWGQPLFFLKTASLARFAQYPFGSFWYNLLCIVSSICWLWKTNQNFSGSNKQTGKYIGLHGWGWQAPASCWKGYQRGSLQPEWGAWNVVGRCQPWTSAVQVEDYWKQLLGVAICVASSA